MDSDIGTPCSIRFGQNAKTCLDGPDKMPTKKLGRTKCQPQKKVRTICQPLVGIMSGWHFVRLAFCPTTIFFASACSVTSLWPGLPKDLWELSQMLGRGGRDGSQAAFVSLVWVGQAGRLPLHAKFFVSFHSLQVVEVLARLWAGCSWSRRWNDRPARGLP